MLKKRFLICLALLAALLVANLAMIQAASSSDLTFTLNDSGDGYIVSACKTTTSGTLSIPATYNSKPVVEIGREAFLNCTGLTSVTIPTSVKTIGFHSFDGCTGLTSVTIPDSVTTLDWFAFANCTGLTKVTIGNGVTCVDAAAFSGCTKLTSVTLGNGVTSIGWSAFKDCAKLSSINIPNSVKAIDRYAFYNCSSLSSVTYCGTASEWNAITKGEGNNALSSVTVTYHKYTNCVCSLCQDSTHSPAQAVKENQKAATCSAAGSYDSVVYCSSCKAEISRDTVSVPATSHTEVIDKAVAATCTETGLTEGKHCSVCNKVLVARTVVDALGHTEQTVPGYAATCTETGLTDGVICSVCDAVITEQTEIPATGHNYVDGTCSCGATEACNHEPGEAVIENLVASIWSAVGSYDEVIYCSVCDEEISRETKAAALNPFYNNAMELSSQLTLHIIIKVNTLGFNNDMDAIKASGYYAVITRIDQNGDPVETTIPASEWLNHTNQRMKIPFSDWTPLHMADALEVAIYNNNGEKISVELETSVRAIAMDEIQKAINAGGLDDYAAMLVDMLNYGAASQIRFTYNTDDLANSTLTDEMKGYATANAVYTAKKDNSGVAVYQSTAMELGSRVEMNLVLWNDAFGVDLSQVEAEISYYTYNGILVQKTVSGENFKEHTPKNGRARSKLVIDWLDIPDCKADVTIVFKDLEGNEIATITESMLSALGTYMEALPDVELYPALIKFINSAYARFS